MKKIISFAGKGGVGKTTGLVLFLKYLIENFKNLNILVIDADPDANIGDVIGKNIHFRDTIGGKMREFRRNLSLNLLPPQMNKMQVIESEVFSCLIETDKYDLLEMGRSEGEGCYCYINDVLKHAIDIIADNYDITLIDSPAGLEHFARKTGRDVTDLVIVTDPSKMGIHTMNRIFEVSKEVELKFKNIWVLGNRFPENLSSILEKKVKYINEKNVHLLGFIPNDSEISKINLTGENLLDLSTNNPSYQQSINLFAKIFNSASF